MRFTLWTALTASLLALLLSSCTSQQENAARYTSIKSAPCAST